jgi:beta-lactam-binding protein with PASTA domain
MQRTHLATRFAARISDAPPNVVIEQYPSAGTRVREKTPALVVISAGPQPPIIRADGGGGGD